MGGGDHTSLRLAPLIRPRFREATFSHKGRRTLRINRDHAAADLVEFDRLVQRLEVAVAEALVALALDDFEEDRADHGLGEDLQQDALVTDIAVDQDAVLLQPLQVVAVPRHALVHQPVIGLDRVL